MPSRIFSILDPGERLAFTGERYTPGVPGDIQNEHYHRYLFALRLCEGLDVLDVASGEGYGTALLATVARSVVGVDIDEASVTFSARTYIRDNLSFRAGSALALPLDDASVDTVISFETLEHLVDSSSFLREVRRVLRPGGIFAVSTPDKKVYSEEPGYHNPFHLGELYREEFWDLLTASFPHVQMFEQQVLAGSVLSVVGEAKGGGTESFATTDGQNFEHKASLPNAPYLVAIASFEPISLPSVSALHGLWTDAAAASYPMPAPSMPSLAGPIVTANDAMALHAEISDLRGRLLDANLEAGKIQRQLLEMDHERGFLRAMLTTARHLADLARAELVHVRSVELARAAEVANIRESMEGKIEAIIESTKATIQEAKAEVKQAKAEAAAQATAVIEARTAAHEARFATELDVIRRSTSWRVTRPLRGAKNLARRILRQGSVR
jgi:ubiquinone/menaquinone biosynthesis C-methylase UbiE